MRTALDHADVQCNMRNRTTASYIWKSRVSPCPPPPPVFTLSSRLPFTHSLTFIYISASHSCLTIVFLSTYYSVHWLPCLHSTAPNAWAEVGVFWTSVLGSSRQDSSVNILTGLGVARLGRSTPLYVNEFGTQLILYPVVTLPQEIRRPGVNLSAADVTDKKRQTFIPSHISS